jgi:hypothetical protein
MPAHLTCVYLGSISNESFAQFVATRIRAVRWPGGEEPLYNRADLDRWLDLGAPRCRPEIRRRMDR